MNRHQRRQMQRGNMDHTDGYFHYSIDPKIYQRWGKMSPETREELMRTTPGLRMIIERRKEFLEQESKTKATNR